MTKLTKALGAIVLVLPAGLAAQGRGNEGDAGGLSIVRRDSLLSNPGRYGVPDEQLHYPYLYESAGGAWYMTYREGPHLESLFGPGNRVQCIQSRDRGKSWLPWMGLTPEPWLYQFFITRLKDGSLITYRCRMEQLRSCADGTTEGTAIILRSTDDGATWTRHTASVTNLPYTPGRHLVTLWGHAIEMPDGRLVSGIISREKGSLAGVAESTDGGDTWKYLASVCEDPTVGERREPGLVRLASGELVAVLRTGLSASARMVQVRSADGGRTWSRPRKLGAPGASPQLLLLGNGVLICSYGTRRDVHVMASWDGTGRTWSEPVPVYKGQTSGYTNVQALAPDRFRIVYAESTFDKYQEGGNRIVRVEVKAIRPAGRR